MPPKRTTKPKAAAAVAIASNGDAVDEPLDDAQAQPKRKRAPAKPKTSSTVASTDTNNEMQSGQAADVTPAKKRGAAKSKKAAEKEDPVEAVDVEAKPKAKRPPAKKKVANVIVEAAANEVGESVAVEPIEEAPPKKKRAPTKKAAAAKSLETTESNVEEAINVKPVKGRAKASKKNPPPEEPAVSVDPDVKEVETVVEKKRAAPKKKTEKEEAPPAKVTAAKKPAAGRRKKADAAPDSETATPAKKRARKVASYVENNEDAEVEEPAKVPAKKTGSRKKATKEETPKKKAATKKLTPKAVSAETSEEPAIEAVPDQKTVKEVKPKKGRAKKESDDKPTENGLAAESPKPVSKKAAPKRKPDTNGASTSEAASPKAAKKPKIDVTDDVTLPLEPSTEAPAVDTISSASYDIKKDHKMKISSWNVAGLRALMKKDGLQFLEKQKPDIFCMQEIKCLSDEVPEAAKVKGYHYYWLSKPGGRAGVALYSKVMPYSVEYGIGDDEQDSDGRLITAEYSLFYLVCVYVPNSGRQLVTLPKRMRWNILFEEHLRKLDAKKPVIICGDLNVSHLEIDLANPKANRRSAGFTAEERDDMTKLLDSGFVDTFRMLYPDQRHAYTYWTYMANARERNIGWRLDYFLVSERLQTKVVDNVIQSQVKGSDHCPITLFINI